MLTTQNRRPDDVFALALRNRRDVTDRFWADYGGLPGRIALMGESEAALKERVRGYMERAELPCQLSSLADWAAPHRGAARTLLDSGDAMAVDGTDAVPTVSHMVTSSYVVAVASVTRRSRETPSILLTETSTRYVDPEVFRSGEELDLREICNTLDRFRDNGSWSTTFREYAERRFALDHPHSVTILDGPIFTQNLLTQAEGRKLYDELLAAPGRIWIGVIKDVSQSTAEVRWCAYALRRGEGFVVGLTGGQLIARFEDQSSGVLRWVEHRLKASSPTDEFIRVVYRPGEKSFAYECRLSDLGLATAILLEDASPTLHHEIPLLLETVDAQLRGGFRNREIRTAVIGRLQRQDWQMGIDATHERDLR